MRANGEMNMGMRFIKYLLFAVNILFALTGVMIISVGTTIHTVYKDFDYILNSSYVSPAIILIIVGALVFIISFFGCCGAYKESTCMVLVFAVSLSIVLILELAAAITAFVYQSDITNTVEVELKDMMDAYYYDTTAKTNMDLLQRHLGCCGFQISDDWLKITGDTYPASCCRLSDNSQTCLNPYTREGCMVRLGLIVSHSALYIETAALSIMLVQLTGIMFACVLGRAIRRQKTERERRRWELRENLINGYQPIGKFDSLTSFPVVYTQHPTGTVKSSVMS